MKNFYETGMTNLSSSRFYMRVIYRKGSLFSDHILGIDLLSILGLDKFDLSGLPNPDGRFDFIPGLTVDPGPGEIMMPTLRPFDSTIVEYFKSRGIVVPDSLLESSQYDTSYAYSGPWQADYYLEAVEY
ncbi:MAG TPA: hypothetical protein VLY03_02785 [Bacteroidota bacterium]|nr:hypothetical protein [Bacteroidota bacterium]